MAATASKHCKSETRGSVTEREVTDKQIKVEKKEQNEKKDGPKWKYK